MPIYTDFRKLGSGGFGEVWVCKRKEDGKVFAKKKLLPSVGEDSIRRFREEVRLLHRLDHPNVIKVIGLHLQQAPYWYVMPKYRHTLKDVLHAIQGDEDRIARVFGSILDAIEYTHGEGVIHRDLKPENVLMNGDDDLAVTDFGLGRILDSASTRHTITGYPMGTPLYMAPEQMANAKNADERSDIYSLGRLLLELHVGELASTATDTSSLAPGVAMVIEKCTRTNPDKRYQSVADLKQAWHYVSGTVAATSPHEELTKLIAQFSAQASVSPEQAERVLDILTQFRTDTDLVHEAIMQLPPLAAQLMLAANKNHTRDLIGCFVTHVTSQGWGFSYTDKIAAQCRALYEALADYQIRADLVFCVLDLGIGHNRFFVMDIAESLLETKREVGENLAIAERLKEASSSIRDWVKEHVSPSKLHPAILSVLND
ncbi:MAG TPA: serine/threonine-protein kinase [Gemmataceae bacterium]|nr:serine/threonine-protein kinase [Gemmataceae bacterium]